MLFDELNRPTISVFTPSAYKTWFFWRGAFLSIECELHQPFVIEEPTATSLVVDCEIRNFNGIKGKKMASDGELFETNTASKLLVNQIISRKEPLISNNILNLTWKSSPHPKTFFPLSHQSYKSHCLPPMMLLLARQWQRVNEAHILSTKMLLRKNQVALGGEYWNYWQT